MSRPIRLGVYMMKSFEYPYSSNEEKEFLIKKADEINKEGNVNIRVYQHSRLKNILVIKSSHPYATFLLGYLLATKDRDDLFYKQIKNFLRLRNDN